MIEKDLKDILRNTCTCPICTLGETVIEFTESLLGPKEMEQLKKHSDGVISDTENLDVGPAIGLILTSALAETAFRQVVPPEIVRDCILAAYDLRVKKLIGRLKGNPELIDQVTQMFKDEITGDSSDD